MNIISCADPHVRHSTPQYRLDNYPFTILRKVNSIVKIANHYEAKLTISGDIFDNVRPEYEFVNKLIAVLLKCKHGVYTTYGQHDLRHHQPDLMLSPYLTLVTSGAVVDVTNCSVDNIYGIPWEGKNIHTETDGKSVLLVHRCITKDTPPFYLKEAISAKKAIREYSNFRFICSGDFHKPHATIFKGRMLLNCGSVGRSNTDQRDHRPSVFLFNTDTPCKFKRIFIPVESPEKVFATKAEPKEENTELSDRVKELAAELKNKKTRPKYSNIVKLLLHKANANKRCMEIARSVISVSRGVE